MNKKEHFNGTKIEEELQQHGIPIEKAINYADQCLFHLWKYHDEVTFKDEKGHLGTEQLIKTYCSLMKYTIRVVDYYLSFLEQNLKKLPEYLEKRELSTEQKESIADLKNTYFNAFIDVLCNSKPLEKKKEIISNLEKIG